MRVNTPSTTTLLLSALGLTTASPLTTRSTSPSFKLIYRGLSGTILPIPLKGLAHGAWGVTTSPTTPTRLILSNDTPGALLTFYQYDTGVAPAVATSGSGLTITPGGSATVPSINELQLTEGSGTRGVGVRATQSGDAPAIGFANGKFMACLDGSEVVLRFASEGQRILEDCMETELLVRCMPEGEGEGELGQAVDVECHMTPF